MKNLSISLTVVAVVLLATSTGSAAWVHVGPVRVVAPVPIVHSYPVVVPVLPHPAYIYPSRAYYAAPVVVGPRRIVGPRIVGPRILVPRRVLRRAIW